MELSSKEKELNLLFDELVPRSGKSESLAGEIVRATARIGYRYFNDGDHIGIGYGKETCNAAARFLLNKAGDEVACIVKQLWGLDNESDYAVLLDSLTSAVVSYVNDHPELREQETEDMFDYTDADEDRDDCEDDDDDL